MINIIPSILLQNGRAAKISVEQNRFSQLSPIDLAQLFDHYGFQKVHVVDVEGAMKGSVTNQHVVGFLKNFCPNLEINFSGGIRNVGDVNEALESGAASVTIATVAAQEPPTFNEWLISYGPSKIMLGADVADGKIATKGWAISSNIKVQDLIAYYVDRGLSKLKLTDVKRDGIAEGPNFGLVEMIRKAFPHLDLFVSGGVRGIDDIKSLESLGVNNVIMATSIYKELIPLEELAKVNSGQLV